MSSPLMATIITLVILGYCFRSIIKKQQNTPFEKFSKTPLSWQHLLRALERQTPIRIALLTANVLASFEKPPEQ